MMLSILRTAAFVLSLASALYAVPDISNLNNCIQDVLKAEAFPTSVPSFDPYRTDYTQLLTDLEGANATLPYVYQEAAGKPLIQFLQDLGEEQFLKIFSEDPQDENSAVLLEIIPDASLSILFHKGTLNKEINAFQEIVSDLYDGFLSDEVRVSQQTERPIEPPTYGVIPPLVKFGNPEWGPYTWPCNVTRELLGMKCAIVNLPPAQLSGGLIAWTSLGHETSGHDVIHADAGLIEELSKKVYDAVWKKFKLRKLAEYWANCIDETASDVCGYLNIGPSAAIGLIGYFRALGNGKLRTIGAQDDPHPIDLLRGYLAASVVKRLHFTGAREWSELITKETNKDKGDLYLVDEQGIYHRFPISFSQAILCADLVAQVIMQSPLSSLQMHSLQELQDWKDSDQKIVDNLAFILKTQGQLPANLHGPGFYASYVVASATQAALGINANISMIFGGMLDFLSSMHLQNPTWSETPTYAALARLEQGLKGVSGKSGTPSPIYTHHKVPKVENELEEKAFAYK